MPLNEEEIDELVTHILANAKFYRDLGSQNFMPQTIPANVSEEILLRGDPNKIRVLLADLERQGEGGNFKFMDHIRPEDFDAFMAKMNEIFSYSLENPNIILRVPEARNKLFMFFLGSRAGQRIADNFYGNFEQLNNLVEIYKGPTTRRMRPPDKVVGEVTQNQIKIGQTVDERAAQLNTCLRNPSAGADRFMSPYRNFLREFLQDPQTSFADILREFIMVLTQIKGYMISNFHADNSSAKYVKLHFLRDIKNGIVGLLNARLLTVNTIDQDTFDRRCEEILGNDRELCAKLLQTIEDFYKSHNDVKPAHGRLFLVPAPNFMDHKQLTVSVMDIDIDEAIVFSFPVVEIDVPENKPDDPQRTGMVFSALTTPDLSGVEHRYFVYKNLLNFLYKKMRLRAPDDQSEPESSDQLQLPLTFARGVLEVADGVKQDTIIFFPPARLVEDRVLTCDVVLTGDNDETLRSRIEIDLPANLNLSPAGMTKIDFDMDIILHLEHVVPDLRNLIRVATLHPGVKVNFDAHTKEYSLSIVDASAYKAYKSRSLNVVLKFKNPDEPEESQYVCLAFDKGKFAQSKLATPYVPVVPRVGVVIPKAHLFKQVGFDPRTMVSDSGWSLQPIEFPNDIPAVVRLLQKHAAHLVSKMSSAPPGPPKAPRLKP